MNRVLFERDEIDPQGRVVLTDRRARHLCQVLRVRPGDALRVGVVCGPAGQATVVAAGQSENDTHTAEAELSGFRVELELAFESADLRSSVDASAGIDADVTRPAVDLILAVPRPKALPRVIQSAAALGVGRIDLINAWRVDKSYLQARQLEPAALAREARLGCEQGGATWVPKVEVHPLLMGFVRAHLDDRLQAVDQAIIAHPYQAAPIEAVLTPGSQARVLLAVGPEGGWIERELDTFCERGFGPVTCSERILRVETAISALLSQIALLRRL